MVTTKPVQFIVMITQPRICLVFSGTGGNLFAHPGMV